MALVNARGADPVRAPPGQEGRRLALGAAVSLALHIGGLAAALGVSLRGEEPDAIVVEVVWETASAEPPAETAGMQAEQPPSEAMEQAMAEPPPPEPDARPPAETERRPPEPEPPQFVETEPEPPPRPVATTDAPRAEAPPPQPPRPALKPSRRDEPTPAEARAAPVAADRSAPPPAVAAAAPSPAPAALSASSASAQQEEEYVRTLLRWLEPHRRYPRSARLRGVEGEVRVSLTIDRAGSIRAARIVQSSGARILDSAALDMIARAAPAPPLPLHMPAAQAEFVIPLRFALTD